MKFTGTLRAPKINMVAYKAALKEHLGNAIAQATILWLGKIETLVPVWSGASMGTFLKLGSEIDFAIPIAPVGTAPNRIALGLENSNGKVTADEESGHFSFHYDTSLKHLIVNEYQNANLFKSKSGKQLFHLKRPGPYRFQEQGRQEFEKYAKDVRLPNPFDYLVATPIRVA